MADTSPSRVRSGDEQSQGRGLSSLIRRASRVLRRAGYRISRRFGQRGLAPVSDPLSVTLSPTERMLQANKRLTSWSGTDPETPRILHVRQIPKIHHAGPSASIRFFRSIVERHRPTAAQGAPRVLPLVPRRPSIAARARIERPLAGQLPPRTREERPLVDRSPHEGYTTATRSRLAIASMPASPDQHPAAAELAPEPTQLAGVERDVGPPRRDEPRARPEARDGSDLRAPAVEDQAVARPQAERRPPAVERTAPPQPVDEPALPVYRALPDTVRRVPSVGAAPDLAEPVGLPAPDVPDLPLAGARRPEPSSHTLPRERHTEDESALGEREPPERPTTARKTEELGELTRPARITRAQSPPVRAAEMVEAVSARHTAGRSMLSAGAARLSRWVQRKAATGRPSLSRLVMRQPGVRQPSEVKLTPPLDSGHEAPGPGPRGEIAMVRAGLTRATRRDPVPGTSGRDVAARDRLPSSSARGTERETDSAAAPGRPLRPGQRQAMESFLDDDFGDVQIHADSAADAAAAAIDADAFTAGRDIFFATGKADFDTEDGLALLSHELTHVRQGREVGATQSAPGALRADAEEQEAAASERTVHRFLQRDGPPRLRWQRPAMDLPDLSAGVSQAVSADELRPRVGQIVASPGARPTSVARAAATRAQAPTGTVAEATVISAETESTGVEEKDSIDVDALAREVYERIMRRLNLERERIGDR